MAPCRVAAPRPGERTILRSEPDERPSDWPRPPSHIHPSHSQCPKKPLILRVRTLLAALFIGVLCFAVYNANLRLIGAGDTLPARYLPLILWHDHTLAFDANARLVAHAHPVEAPRNRPADTGGSPQTLFSLAQCE